MYRVNVGKVTTRMVSGPTGRPALLGSRPFASCAAGSYIALTGVNTPSLHLQGRHRLPPLTDMKIALYLILTTVVLCVSVVGYLVFRKPALQQDLSELKQDVGREVQELYDATKDVGRDVKEQVKDTVK